ncbi:NADP-dependent glyceraldehyde-3-phosphate dehydrogenase [Mesoplasma sp. JKS002658]|uniref:NADP-dependent glyceraldehyde-3-phosphate dehydrogenase n=1 Tax=Mesoplasma whartonense TaxID=2878854 RepID=UPI002022A47A|nr:MULTISPECIES: NADP-dependent glyceraldehyde-3-phosphate dehydrogenase [unclassified Mesoplasma]MCL8211476.1 NADP-dependent glyceraldehyde-3-phosphate dehydrogenase [Mesoplasma sp. JKS002664]MCL8211936.1 NADP-dependent glyceraldehyde-3-phosphate dehydrogenase [Mesoplasma sp. JKS002662]MCL8212971.1 NADP-dependent glyceraldehyde-3-phosphate dehydrogenase [Mesoplasma sp. JKS002661]MCL8213959.1 NADP-dependent glyceraldehyde-3-phosphate dehydrogenase [Mesoplasma sp. JKS002658]MCL8214925.1 NADP-de
MYKFDAMINNEFVSGANRVEILNPTTLESAGSVAGLEEKDIDQAYQAARKAQQPWADLPLMKRIEVLKKWNALIQEKREEIAKIMVSEVAKGYKASLSEVDRTVEYFDYTLEEAKRLEPSVFTGRGMGVNNKYALYDRVPKGVGLAISPFNYPLNLSMSKIAPDLVMGNTVVFKPATAGSLTGSYLGKLAVEAGLPKGIFNVVTGRGSVIGDIITQNQELDFISFTGSVKVGHHILEIAKTKDVILELGGKDPALVLDANNLEFVAEEIISGGLSYSGQRCTAIKRVLTTNAIADQLVPLLKEKISKLSVGKPEDDAFITPVIDEKTADYVQGLIDDAQSDGATIVFGNSREKNLMQPTLVDRVDVKSRLAWEEPFGPVLPVIRNDNVEELIKLANQSNFGLQASVFTTDLDLAISVARKIEAGTVNINGKSQRGPDSFPFLGIKDSGYGVQGIHETLLSCTRYRGIVINYKDPLKK